MPDAAPEPRSATRDVVPFRVATRVWFAISLRTFGGPAGQIAVMHRELVDDRRWIGDQRFLRALSFCTLLPGPEAQQLAIYLGWLLNGTTGGLVAGTLFVLPGYVVLMVLSAIYAAWGATSFVVAVFAGLGPAVIAIVAQAVQRIASRSLGNPFLVTVAVGAFAGLFVFAVPFPIVVASAALAGWVAGRVRPDVVRRQAGHGSGGGVQPLIADDALHGERPSWGRAARIVVIGVVLWFAPVLAAAAAFGTDHVFVDLGKFFSGTAVVTFGGAYAVLAYITQRAVNTYHWLLPGEMVNGLALAETTPGPLIMVVQFVGFLAAYRNPGDLNPWVAAVIGATLVVWVTFVPCFMFVFVGAPHIEALRESSPLADALSGVMAAVVGVIANLSVFFAIHTLFDDTVVHRAGPVRLEVPVWSSLDGVAVAVTALAVVCVFRLKWSVLRTLGVCAVVGATLHLVTT